MRNRCVLGIITAVIASMGTVIWPTDAVAQSSPVAEFNLSDASSWPNAIAAGPDGNVWFYENRNTITRITPAGATTDFAIPAAASSIVTGPDTNLWFTEVNVAKIGRMTTTGVVAEFVIPNIGSSIIAGPDGKLWFAESSAAKIGRIDVSGTVTEFTPPPDVRPTKIGGLTAGADGNIWTSGISTRG